MFYTKQLYISCFIFGMMYFLINTSGKKSKLATKYKNNRDVFNMIKITFYLLLMGVIFNIYDNYEK